MEKFLQGYFYNPTKGKLSLQEVVRELFYYVNEKPEMFYDIIIGCDSSSEQNPCFPVALVVLRKGEGGRFFIKRINYKGESGSNEKFQNWKQRILEEVLLSCQLALFLRESFEKEIKKSPNPFNYQFRYIHADVGENGQTKDMIKEVVGLIRGNGFEAKIKPEAYAASVVADKYS